MSPLLYSTIRCESLILAQNQWKGRGSIQRFELLFPVSNVLCFPCCFQDFLIFGFNSQIMIHWASCLDFAEFLEHLNLYCSPNLGSFYNYFFKTFFFPAISPLPFWDSNDKNIRPFDTVSRFLKLCSLWLFFWVSQVCSFLRSVFSSPTLSSHFHSAMKPIHYIFI